MSDEHDAWWTIHSSDFMAAMRRAHAGEDPDLLYIEYVANSETRRYGEGDDA